MNRFAWVGLPCLLSLSFACASAPRARAELPAAPASRRSIVERILRHNVRVLIHDGKALRRTASGVVVGAEPTTGGAYAYVVTNAHVLDPGTMQAPKVSVLVDHGADEIEYAAEPVVVGKVPEMDLALLRVRGAALTPAELAPDSELALGEDVMVVAAPYGKAMSLSGGMISLVEWDRARRTPKMLKTDAAIGYGASGGGIFSRTTGRLVAIVEGYRTAKVGFVVAEQNYSFDVPMPGETFGAPSAKLRAFLESAGFGKFVGRSGVTAQAERAALE